MKTFLWCAALTMVILCGCTERARQKGFLSGGDPALATDADMKALKADVHQLKNSVEEIRSQLQK